MPAPLGFRSPSMLASITHGLPLLMPSRTASASSDARPTLIPAMPAARAIAAKSGLYGLLVPGCLKSVASSRPPRYPRCKPRIDP
jgi:hypothetical protein